MGSKKFQNKLCVYCWKQASTADHIPPLNWFANRNRSDLVKVPSCSTCNHGFSMDDEYVRMVLSVDDVLAELEDIKEIQEDALRSLKLPAKRGFLRAVQSAIREVERITPSGLYIGRASAVHVDSIRLSQVGARLVRGLYSHEHRTPLPSWCKVTARISWDFAPRHGVAYESFNMLAAYLLRECEPNVMANGAFSYRVSFGSAFSLPPGSELDKYFSLWLLSLYDRIIILGFTGSRQKAIEHTVEIMGERVATDDVRTTEMLNIRSNELSIYD